MNTVFSKKHVTYRLPKILLFEDDAATAEVMQFYFKMNGYICKVKTTGSNALSYIKQELPSLVIVDYLLPELNGLELCTALKRDPLTASCPVILYTAYTNIPETAKHCGCDLFIAKPLDLDDVLQKVHQLLGRRMFTIYPITYE